jgi:4-diphosphocytidyl-2-C-methyl-D-erythritol kinase
VRLERLARAKVNLFLHVGAAAADGYHPLSSLVTFADVGDLLVLDDAAPAGLTLSGPFAGTLDGGGNLVERAWRAIFEAAGRPPPPLRLTLEKRLPVAAGLGGGSADAAAALRLAVERFGLEAPPGLLAEVGLRLGSDVPVCLHGDACLMSGRGEVIGPAPHFAEIASVLVNPGASVPTGAVFARFDAMRPGGGDLRVTPAPPGHDDFIGWLAVQRNDLEAPAIEVEPVIGDVLAALRAAPQTQLARMCGSGATCFALCRDRAAADALADGLRAAQPDWWVVSTVLAGAG